MPWHLSANNMEKMARKGVERAFPGVLPMSGLGARRGLKV